MPAIHSTAIEGFTQQAQAYAQLRPSYPSEALDQIKSLIPDANARIIDLAAGTGKMTRLLLEHGYMQVTAVEPVDAMREALVTLLPQANAIQGSGWNIPVPSQSQDAIIVAQAFHWFADIESLQEIHRVLKPNGFLILVWNKEDTSQDKWIEQLYELCSQHAKHHHRAWRAVFEENEAKRLFHLPLNYRRFSHSMRYTKQDILALTQTRSYISTLSENDKKQHKRKVEAVMGSSEVEHAFNDDGTIKFPYVSNFFYTQKK